MNTTENNKTSKKQEIKALDKLTRLADYLSVAQIFLADNFFLDKYEKPELKKEDIKKRLLGHWGTCPGTSFVMAQVNRQITQNENEQSYKHSIVRKNNNKIKDSDREFMFVDGPGHGFPAYQANIMIEGSLSHFYGEEKDDKNKESFRGGVLNPQHYIPYTKEGLTEIIENFSTPYGYPSHLNPEAPGVILEGGELGYSLAVSSGAVLDNPDLISVTLVGDGEAETASLASSWNFNKFISPKTDGAVLPVLHLNGYKISGPTVFGRMSDSEIKKYFNGLGYKVYFIDYFKKKNLHLQGMEVFDKAISRIKKIQKKARSGQSYVKPEWPVIILKTPKGYGAPEKIGDKKIVGNAHSHQVVFDNLKSESQREMLTNWLQSYKIEEVVSFEEGTGNIILSDDVKGILPPLGKTIGLNKQANGLIGQDKPLVLPDFEEIYKKQEISKEYHPIKKENSMIEVGKYFRDVMAKNNNFRIFSPDETYSNRIYNMFEETHRVWQWPIKSFDKDMAQEGKVIEIVSENLLFGMLWGYVLSGRYGFFTSYEAFAQITASMLDQYIKFIKVARDVHFRKDYPSFNVVLSSLLERQDHNGYSHQNPSFISAALDRDLDIVNVFFPADKNVAKLALEKSLSLRNSVNISVIGKKMTRTWLTEKEAYKQVKDGIMVWGFLSEENPDIVMATCGDYVTEESVAGVLIFRELFPHVKIRFVNIFNLDVFAGDDGSFKNHGLVKEFFTEEKQIIFNYHGYKSDIKKMLFEYNLSKRITINGYEEKGSTTSSFDLKARNGLSRYDLVMDMLEASFVQGLITEKELSENQQNFENKKREEKEYIIKHKDDPEYISLWDLDNTPM